MDGPDLSHLLDGGDSDLPSAAVLEGIVRRHRRLRARRARAAATLGVVLALAGAGVGLGLSQQHPATSALGQRMTNPTAPATGSTGTKGVPTGSPPRADGSPPAGLGWVDAGSETAPDSLSATASSGLSAASARLQTARYAASSTATPANCSTLGCPTLSPTVVSLGDLPLRRLFTRTSDGVTVRAFTAVWAVAPLELVPVTTSGGTSSGHSTTGTAPAPAPAPALPSSCALSRALVVEVSDAGAVGVVTVPLGPSLSQPLDVLADQVVGVAEGSPIAVVVAHVSDATTAVRADFAGGGQDVMTVVDGWAVLVRSLEPAASAPPGSGTKPLGAATVYALSSTGSVLEQAALPGSGALAMAVGACEGGGNHKTPGAGSTGSAGSGSAGSGSAGSGSASSGSAGSGAASTGSTGSGAASTGSTGSAGSTSAVPSDKPNGG